MYATRQDTPLIWCASFLCCYFVLFISSFDNEVLRENENFERERERESIKELRMLS